MKKNKFFNHLSYWLGVVAVGLAVGVSVQFVRAWVAPSSTPPASNIGAPINTGSASQYKTGNIAVNTSSAYSYGLIAYGTYAIYGSGSSYGVRGAGGTYGVYGSGTYGVYGNGSSYGVRGYDSDNGSRGYLGHGSYGVSSYGSGNQGLYSQDGDGSSWTRLNYSNYGIYTNTPIYSGGGTSVIANLRIAGKANCPSLRTDSYGNVICGNISSTSVSITYSPIKSINYNHNSPNQWRTVSTTSTCPSGTYAIKCMACKGSSCTPSVSQYTVWYESTSSGNTGIVELFTTTNENSCSFTANAYFPSYNFYNNDLRISTNNTYKVRAMCLDIN